MSEPGFFKKLYIEAKNTVKSAYKTSKAGAKYALETIGLGEDTETYKFLAKASNVTEPIFSGVTESAEFVCKNLGDTGAVLSDLAGWAIGSDSLDTKRLLNYLYDYSRETGGDVKLLLKELPPDSLSKMLKYVNNKLSNMKNIPCSQVCMDIALSDPKNINTKECRTVNDNVIDNLISDYEDKLTPTQIKRFKEDLPLVEFSANGQHAQMLQENDTLQRKLREWANQPPEKREKTFGVTLNSDSDPENGYDSYATFHNVTIMNPKVDDKGNITAYVYDIYDFERASFNGQMLDFATIMAYHLQETGHLKNYRILVPVTIPAKSDN